MQENNTKEVCESILDKLDRIHKKVDALIESESYEYFESNKLSDVMEKIDSIVQYTGKDGSVKLSWDRDGFMLKYKKEGNLK